MSRKLAILLSVLVTGVLLDQLTKVLVIRHLPLGGQIPVIEGFFNLVHTRNRGAAFGLLSHLSLEVAWLFFLGTTSLVILVVGYLWWRVPVGEAAASEKTRQDLMGLGYSLILTGAVGNLVDRLRLKEVVDFLDFYLGRHHWPAFNIADTLVCLGAALLALVILTEKETPHVSHSV